MENTYIIEYIVDNGCRYDEDTAIVIAKTEDDAVGQLKSFINNINSETMVYKIKSISELKSKIFTNLYGTGEKIL